MKKAWVLILVLSVLFSCKSAKVDDSEVSYLPARAIVKKNRQASLSQERIKASMSIKYRGSQELPNISASLRMVKDSIIWINFSKLGFPIAKLRITATKLCQ